ncbi:glycosyltransferase [Candidatus Pelagibacter sp.]|nr:glycosyltransferase [Candidatus Pelagibacter sp.]
MKPDVSVILPNFNGEKYLYDSIESILDQSFKNFEFIIIDDGSTDASKDIINNFSKLDNRIQTYFLKKIGYTNALNFALSKSYSNLIARMDSDDISLNTRLEKQINFMSLNKNSNVAVCGSGIRAIDSNNKFLYNRILPEKSFKIKRLLPHQNVIVHPSVMMRKNIIMSVGGYNPKFEPAEDYDLWLRLLYNKNDFYNLRDPLISYRYHDKSVTSSRLKEQFFKSSYAKKNFLTNYNFMDRLVVNEKNFIIQNKKLNNDFFNDNNTIFYNYFLILMKQTKISIFSVVFFKILLKCLIYDFSSTIRLIFIKLKLKF